MSKRKAEQDASDSDSDQSVPDNFSSVGPVPSYEICIDKAVLKIEVDLIVETDEERCLKFVELLNSAKVGSEIVNALKTLNSSGQKFAISLTMNRVLKALGLLKLLDETDMTNKWGKESDSLVSCFDQVCMGGMEAAFSKFCKERIERCPHFCIETLQLLTTGQNRRIADNSIGRV